MTHGDFADIAEPHRSAITAILLAVELGVFTEAEAGLFIDRVRMRVSLQDCAAPAPISVDLDRGETP